MKNSKSLIAAFVFATASLGSSAVMAADISSGPETLSIPDESAFFGSTFAANNANDTFADQFNFTIGAVPSSVDAIVSSISRSAVTGLNISNLQLFSSNGNLITTGMASETGATDVWTVSSGVLSSGNYYLQVSGSLVSNTSGSFGGSVQLNPVPEPETYGMMIAGLGVLGFLARRRKAANQA